MNAKGKRRVKVVAKKDGADYRGPFEAAVNLGTVSELWLPVRPTRGGKSWKEK